MSIPPPSERPDLYDYFDFLDRPEGWTNPIIVPERIRRLIDAKNRDRQEGTDIYFRAALAESENAESD